MNYQRHPDYRIMQNNDTLTPVKYSGLYKEIGIKKKSLHFGAFMTFVPNVKYSKLNKSQEILYDDFCQRIE